MPCTKCKKQGQGVQQRSSFNFRHDNPYANRGNRAVRQNLGTPTSTLRLFNDGSKSKLKFLEDFETFIEDLRNGRANNATLVGQALFSKEELNAKLKESKVDFAFQ